MLKRKLLGGALAALTLGAAVAGSAAPASAQWRDGPYGYYGRGPSPGAAAAAGAIGGLALGAALAAPRPIYAPPPLYAYPRPVYVAPPPECYVTRHRVWVPGWGWEVRRERVCED